MPKSPIIELVDDQGNPNFVIKTNAGQTDPALVATDSTPDTW
jgi:hypothetical protein